MSRTYRKYSSLFKSEKYLRSEWEYYQKPKSFSPYRNKKGLKTFEDFKRYVRAIESSDNNKGRRIGYRGGSNGFKANGAPTGWDDDFARVRSSRRIANGRRRQWDKAVIRQGLDEDLD